MSNSTTQHDSKCWSEVWGGVTLSTGRSVLGSNLFSPSRSVSSMHILRPQLKQWEKAAWGPNLPHTNPHWRFHGWQLHFSRKRSGLQISSFCHLLLRCLHQSDCPRSVSGRQQKRVQDNYHLWMQTSTPALPQAVHFTHASNLPNFSSHLSECL